MTISEALTDLRDTLIEGETVADAIRLVAEDYGIAASALEARAIKAYGELDQVAERHRAMKQAEQSPVTQQRLQRGEVRQMIDDYNSGRRRSEDTVDAIYRKAFDAGVSIHRTRR